MALAVEALGVAHVQWLQGALQAVIGCGYGDQVDMIGHQAIGQYFNLVLFGVVFQPRQIHQAIIIVKEHRLASIATLGDVVRKTCKYGSGQSRHWRSILKKGSVPFFASV